MRYFALCTFAVLALPLAAGETVEGYPAGTAWIVNLPEGASATELRLDNSRAVPRAVFAWDDAGQDWVEVAFAVDARRVPLPGVKAVKLAGFDAKAARPVFTGRLADGSEGELPVDAPKPDAGAKELRPDPEGVASGAASNPDTVWYPNGIDGKWLAVGNPNMWNRRDKVTVRFDLTPFVPAGQVRRAVLTYGHTPFGYRSNELVLEHFTTERLVLAGNDLISNQVEPLRHYVVDREMKAMTEARVDVTGALNADLAAGFGFTTFRIACVTAEILANPRNDACGVTIEPNFRLYVLP